jgi:hypothetical protein
VIKQGYLTKRSQGKGRHDWKRRFFVLDSTGMMYYFSHKVTRKPLAFWQLCWLT